MSQQQQPLANQREVVQYLEQKKIIKLMEYLAANVFIDKPEHGVKNPELFNELDVKSYFDILDASKKGSVSMEKYHQAMQTLGIKNYTLEPEGAKLNAITQEVFKAEVMNGLGTK